MNLSWFKMNLRQNSDGFPARVPNNALSQNFKSQNAQQNKNSKRFVQVETKVLHEKLQVYEAFSINGN